MRRYCLLGGLSLLLALGFSTGNAEAAVVSGSAIISGCTDPGCAGGARAACGIITAN